MPDRYLPIEAGDALYAIPLSAVLSVQWVPESGSPIRGKASDGILGIDLSRLFSDSAGSMRYSVLLNVEGTLAALLVDGVRLPRSDAQLIPLPRYFANSLFGAVIAEDLIPVIDLNRLIDLIQQASVFPVVEAQLAK